jgi:STAS-like domain of unknown function (DUF4325)
MGGLLSFSVGSHDAYLATRDAARRMREDLEEQIAQQQPDEVQIDFTGVQAMTISFADEFIGRVFTSLAADDIHTGAVILTGLNSENQEATAICLERRGLMAAAASSGQVTLLGAPSYLLDTYLHALHLVTFSALHLADELEVTPQNMNNRLKRLAASGALRRERSQSDRGGKEFAYAIPRLLSECPT